MLLLNYVNIKIINRKYFEGEGNSMMYFGAVIAMGLIRWEQKKLNLQSFIKDSILVCIILFLIQFIGSYLIRTTNISLSPFHLLPENIDVWIGAILILIVVCTLSFKEWYKKSKQGNAAD